MPQKLDEIDMISELFSSLIPFMNDLTGKKKRQTVVRQENDVLSFFLYSVLEYSDVFNLDGFDLENEMLSFAVQDWLTLRVT